MRYVISKAEILKNRARIFPFGSFFRGGQWRTFSREDAEEMVHNWKAGIPVKELPVNAEHIAALGRLGKFKSVWIGEDGVYASFEWNEAGRRAMQEGRFRYFSPEIRWEYVHPRTGKKYRNVLVGGAVTNYPFLGDVTVLFSEAAQASWDPLMKLAVLEITPATVRRVSDQELLSLHRRMHMLAESLRKSAPTAGDVHVDAPLGKEEEQAGKEQEPVAKVSIEDVVNAHIILVGEMKRRGMHHGKPDNWLDSQSGTLLSSTAHPAVRKLASMEPQETVIVPGFVAVVGSAVHSEAPNDLDILVRAKLEDGAYQIQKHMVHLPIRKLLDPVKEGLTLHWVPSPQGPHSDAVFLGDLVLRIHPRYEAIKEFKEEVEKKVRTFLYFVGTGAMDSPRRDAALMVVSERSAVLFDAGEDIRPEHLPRVPDIILLTDPTENKAPARRLAEEIGVEVGHGDWGGPDLKVKAFPVKHTNHDVFGYLIDVSDLRVAYVPEFYVFPADHVRGVDIGIFDGSAFDRPIRFRGGKGGHAAVLDTLVEAEAAGVKRTIFTHVGKPTDQHLGLLQVSGVEIAQDGQAVVLKAGLVPGRQNFKPLKTGKGYGENEFADTSVAWEVWGLENKPFAVEKKYDGWRVVVHKTGETVRLYSEDAERDLSEKVPAVAKAVEALPGRLILDGELEVFVQKVYNSGNFNYRAGDKVERIDMPSFLNVEDPPVPYRGVYHVFDVLYRDADIHRLPFTERRKALEELLKGREGPALKLVESKVVDTKGSFLRAWKWAREQPNSEGAMLKRIASPYALNGETLEWAKVKAMKEVRGRVVDKKRTRGKAWIYTIALSDGSIIGNTYATGVDADIGDILEMRVAEIKVRREGDKLKFTWDNPIVHSKKPKGTAVTTPKQALALSRLRRTALPVKAFEDEETYDDEVFGRRFSVRELAQAITECIGDDDG